MRVDEVDMEAALGRAKSFFDGDRCTLIFTPNPEIIMLAQGNESLREAINGADLCLADGIGVVLASRIQGSGSRVQAGRPLRTSVSAAKRRGRRLGRPVGDHGSPLRQDVAPQIVGDTLAVSRGRPQGSPLRARVAGYDFLLELLKLNKNVFLLGAKDGVAGECAKRLDNVVGWHHGYFSEDEGDNIIERINASGAEMLVAALGAPKQELWLWENRERLGCKVAIGVGGALDVISGNVKRAPRIWQKLCLEWLYRAIREPKRFKRLAVLPKFIWKVITRRETTK